ncbi:UDP-2-acetamido-2-deoxy-3-oxo-D-glucuronate aminotransferase [Planctomycetes bacterium Pla163]|uniref:UDP-2-acetamido-2-deoxy-3-oxo-D-glucuronate aminotransferase n=1 Tax=Rohdeia mirabilis TaxID=2528008 RepID=A0A518D4G0_9BACT|nr:UDP-2-acetamido-2-deoxy-3-oxo-D-glucuronate aminotransferase [Planctomycetes bacterium Pla163]
MTGTVVRPVPYVDLHAQRRRIAAGVDAAIARVLEHGGFVMGPEIEELEAELARRAGVAHCLTCASGTTALTIPLLARGIGPGDAVFVPSFTFTSTAEVVALRGATPVFVDVRRDTFDMDPQSLDVAIATARAAGLAPRCVIPVDLFGQPADYRGVRRVADAHGLWVLGDAAQSFGASQHGRPVGSLAEVSATSFYPSKPLGCYGDGGAVFTDDDELFERMRAVRVHGQGRDRDTLVSLGLTGRLDSIQAAVLLQKLTIFDDECDRRDEIAARYAERLSDVVDVPVLGPGNRSIWAQYTIRTERRDQVVERLDACCVPTAVFYRRPLHLQAPYAHFPSVAGGLPVTEALADEVVSLPLHPYLEADDQDRVVAGVRAAFGA